MKKLNYHHQDSVWGTESTEPTVYIKTKETIMDSLSRVLKPMYLSHIDKFNFSLDLGSSDHPKGYKFLFWKRDLSLLTSSIESWLQRASPLSVFFLV